MPIKSSVAALEKGAALTLSSHDSVRSKVTALDAKVTALGRGMSRLDRLAVRSLLCSCWLPVTAC